MLTLKTAPPGRPGVAVQSSSVEGGMLCNLAVPVSFRLPDGLTRRGDINLLMLGDPGTAKSQLLKFVERCSPIGVGGEEMHVKARHGK